jgi:formylglycine-generating enzyme required for sulfatase activity
MTADTGHHWPQFAPKACGFQSDRERLGLPDYFVKARFADSRSSLYAQMRAYSQDSLLEAIADARTSLEMRLEAGRQLALLGDPRLVTLEPLMVDIPGGVVQIGLDEDQVPKVMQRYRGLGLDESWIRKECPRHTVVLTAYRIAKYPVTNAEYRDFLLATGHPELPDAWRFRQYPEDLANHPVHTLTPAACEAYAHWLSVQTGRQFRLPTEAEWEFAAAGPQGLEYPWGDFFDADLANTCETGLLSTSAVGAFVGGESPFGASDMAGNVEEYVADDYRCYEGGTPVEDHLSQIHGAYRVARGGSFARFRDLARTRRRHGYNPRSATYVMGFRLCEQVC